MMNTQDFAQIGIECIGTDDFQGAVSAFEKALEINPKDVKAMLFLAICKLALIDEGQSMIDNVKYATSKTRDALGLLENSLKGATGDHIHLK